MNLDKGLLQIIWENTWIEGTRQFWKTKKEIYVSFRQSHIFIEEKITKWCDVSEQIDKVLEQARKP